MNADVAKCLITDTFNDLRIDKFNVLGQGKAGSICLVNGEIVFKIPLYKDEEIAMWQRNEAEVLKFLEGKTDIEIPKIIYEAESEDGAFIFGETYLPGKSLTYEMFDEYFTKPEQNDVYRQLGEIVRNLHDVGGNDPSWLTYGDIETPEEMIDEFYGRFTTDVRNVFSNDEIMKIENIVVHYKTISQEHPVKPVLCHHDLHIGNFMFDIETKKITGMLDFGCAGYTEPARDWHYYFDTTFVLEGYGKVDDIYFSDRQRFHALSWSLNNLSEEIAEDKKSYPYLGYIRDYILVCGTG